MVLTDNALPLLRWGDVFMPLLLWHGGQRLLAIGGIAHFLNALVTFIVSLQIKSDPLLTMLTSKYTGLC